MKIISKILNALVAIFLIANIIVVFLINIHFANLGMIKSATNELTPYVKVNDLIIYQKQNTYQENDIIIYAIQNKYSLAKVKSTTEYLTYIKDNTNKEYNPVSIADVKGKSILILNTRHIILYFTIVFACLIYLIINILLGLKEMKKDSKITS